MNDKPFNVIQAEHAELYEWLKEICRSDKVENFIVPDYKDGRISVRFYTKENRYNISIGDGDNRYLGCTVTTRKPRAGEDWNRGRDLPDGEYCKKTWDKIKDAIVAYELVKVIKSTTSKCIDN